jgi:hypothetical protein
MDECGLDAVGDIWEGHLARSDLFKGFLVGALGAMSGSVASAPFDVIKVRMQIQGELAVATATTGTQFNSTPYS